MFQVMLMSANAFRQIGGLDETIVAYQEWDTAIRLGRGFRFAYESAPTFVYNCQEPDTISKDERRSAQGYSQVVRKHLLPIMLRLGPRAISNHYRVIARHYSLAGDARQTRMSSIIAFLLAPFLRGYTNQLGRSLVRHTIIYRDMSKADKLFEVVQW